MTSIRRIVCATDLSPASTPAWEHARLLADLLKAELLLVHVVPSTPLPMEGYFPPNLYQELMESGWREAQAELERLVSSDGKASAHVDQGNPAARIVAVAAEREADLLVLGTHGHMGLSKLVMGSVADRVIRSAPCPVVTVRARPDGEPRLRGINRICYATDFSGPARAAWPYAVALAEAAGAEIDLVHVTALAVPDRHMTPDALETMARLLREQGEAAAAQFLRNSPLPPDRVTVLVGAGIPADYLLHTAHARSASLIVMGTHGWSGFLRWMLGSVAYHVVQQAECPVLTVGPEGQPAERPHAS